MSNLNEKVREKLNTLDYKEHWRLYNLEPYEVIWNSLKHLFEDIQASEEELYDTFVEEFEWWDENNYVDKMIKK